MIVPPGSSKSPIEKLLGPFEPVLWYLLISIISIGLLTIKIVSLNNRRIQNFVFGANVRSPYLNIFSILFGISMKKISKRNFARTLLMLFTIFCFIIRNSYQGSLFGFLKTNFNGNEISSIDAAVEKDFTFYMVASAQEHTIRVPEVFKRRFILKSSEIAGIRMKTLNPEFQGVLLSSLEQILYTNKLNQKKFILKVCPEHLSTFNYGIYFRKHSFLTHAFDLQILQFLGNGMISHWASKYVDEKYLKPKMEKKDPQALQLDQIAGVFQVLVGGFFLALAIFVLEILYFRFVKN